MITAYLVIKKKVYKKVMVSRLINNAVTALSHVKCIKEAPGPVPQGRKSMFSLLRTLLFVVHISIYLLLFLFLFRSRRHSVPPYLPLSPVRHSSLLRTKVAFYSQAFFLKTKIFFLFDLIFSSFYLSRVHEIVEE